MKKIMHYTDQKTTAASKCPAAMEKLTTGNTRSRVINEELNEVINKEFKRRAEPLESPSANKTLELETDSNDSNLHL